MLKDPPANAGDARDMGSVLKLGTESDTTEHSTAAAKSVVSNSVQPHGL